jgi:hypothetical protein
VTLCRCDDSFVNDDEQRRARSTQPTIVSVNFGTSRASRRRNACGRVAGGGRQKPHRDPWSEEQEPLFQGRRRWCELRKAVEIISLSFTLFLSLSLYKKLKDYGGCSRLERTSLRLLYLVSLANAKCAFDCANSSIICSTEAETKQNQLTQLFYGVTIMTVSVAGQISRWSCMGSSTAYEQCR